MSGDASGLELQWIRDLTEENFFAVYDVVLDIRAELQFNNAVSIAVVPPIVKFRILMPADSPKLRDRYGRLRWQASELLKAKGVLLAVEVVEGGHRWDSTLELRVHRDRFLLVLASIEQERERRAASRVPPEGQSMVAPSNDQAKGEPVMPEKVTLVWLFRHVPVSLWMQFSGLVVAVFLAGVTVGQTSFVQELIGKSPRPTNSAGEAREEKQSASGAELPLSVGATVLVESLNIAVRLEPAGNYNHENGGTHIGFFFPKNPMVRLTEANLHDPAIAAPSDSWFSPVRSENIGLGVLGTFKVALKAHEFSKDGTTVVKVTAMIRKVEDD